MMKTVFIDFGECCCLCCCCICFLFLLRLLLLLLLLLLLPIAVCCCCCCPRDLGRLAADRPLVPPTQLHLVVRSDAVARRKHSSLRER